MRRITTAIFDTISTPFGFGQGGNIVTDLATHRLRGLYLARTLLRRLTDRMPARLRVVKMDHLHVGVPGAALVFGHYCPSTLWPRLSWRPVSSGASLKES